MFLIISPWIYSKIICYYIRNFIWLQFLEGFQGMHLKFWKLLMWLEVAGCTALKCACLWFYGNVMMNLQQCLPPDKIGGIIPIKKLQGCNFFESLLGKEAQLPCSLNSRTFKHQHLAVCAHVSLPFPHIIRLLSSWYKMCLNSLDQKVYSCCHRHRHAEISRNLLNAKQVFNFKQRLKFWKNILKKWKLLNFFSFKLNISPIGWF